jgi:hypothetical protein
MKEKYTWFVVVGFGIAMAWVESAVVVYLRTLIGRLVPYQPDPLPFSVGLGEIELVREVATLVMLLLVGALAGRTWAQRMAYAAIAFGIWDIFYYVFLVPMSGWPRSVFDWDILFLLPLPWWGPVLAPASIAALLVVGGTLMIRVTAQELRLVSRRFTWGFSLVGVGLALYTFMADAVRVSSQGTGAIRQVLPTSFNWGLFVVALALLAAPIPDLGWQMIVSRRAPNPLVRAQSREMHAGDKNTDTA